MKTAGVDASILKFEGRARVFHSLDAACGRHYCRQEGRLGGDVVVIDLRGVPKRARHAGDAGRDASLPSRERGSARRARSSPTDVFRAAPRASASVTSRPRPVKVARSASSRRAIASVSTSPTAASISSSPTRLAGRAPPERWTAAAKGGGRASPLSRPEARWAGDPGRETGPSPPLAPPPCRGGGLSTPRSPTPPPPTHTHTVCVCGD